MVLGFIDGQLHALSHLPAPRRIVLEYESVSRGFRVQTWAALSSVTVPLLRFNSEKQGVEIVQSYADERNKWGASFQVLRFKRARDVHNEASLVWCAPAVTDRLLSGSLQIPDSVLQSGLGSRRNSVKALPPLGDTRFRLSFPQLEIPGKFYFFTVRYFNSLIDRGREPFQLLRKSQKSTVKGSEAGRGCCCKS